MISPNLRIPKKRYEKNQERMHVASNLANKVDLVMQDNIKPNIGKSVFKRGHRGMKRRREYVDYLEDIQKRYRKSRAIY